MIYTETDTDVQQALKRIAKIEQEDDALRQRHCHHCENWLRHAGRCWYGLHPKYCAEIREAKA